MVATFSYFNSPQLGVHSARLAQRFLLRSRSIYDEIREFSFLRKGQLAADPGPDFGFGDAIAVLSPRHLLLFCTGYQDQAVEPFIAAGLDEDGGFDDHNSFRLPDGKTGHQSLLAPHHGRMD